MKYASFRLGSQQGYGVVEGERLLRLDTQPGMPASLKALLPAIARGETPDLAGTPDLALSALTLLPPVPEPGKVICVATNFHEEGKTAPAFPLVFTRFAELLVGHGAPLLKPAVSERYDYEGEMAVVVGLPGDRIAPGDAMRHVAGYACFNDGSVRDWQRHSTQFTPGKNFRQSGSFGPWLVCRSERPEPLAGTLQTRVNGVVKQEIALGRMIFDPAWLIAYASTFTPLAPGDVIVTGTPGGFGATRTPPEFLQPGDRVEVEITGLGLLSNPVAQDSDPRGDIFRNT